MKTINKTMISALLAVSALGLTATSSIYAAAADDAALYCTGCHNGLTVSDAAGTVLGVVGGGARSCPQRTAAEWVTTIDRMNGKGCGALNVSGIAAYLAGLTAPTTTTTTAAPTTTTTTTTTKAPTTTTAAPTTTTAAPTTTTAAPTTTTAAPTTTTAAPTTTTAAPTTTTAAPTTTTAAPTTTTAAPTTTTTVATTTTTTVAGCNTYVNGTTQYKYGGKGSCHSFANDEETGLHIVRDEKYCQQHMTHFNSKGNHVHAYPHPLCM